MKLLLILVWFSNLFCTYLMVYWTLLS